MSPFFLNKTKSTWKIKMDDISNRTLAILLVTAIVVSLGATVNVLNQLQPGAAGRATSGTGNVTLQVSSTVSIISSVYLKDLSPLGIPTQTISRGIKA